MQINFICHSACSFNKTLLQLILTNYTFIYISSDLQHDIYIITQSIKSRQIYLCNKTEIYACQHFDILCLVSSLQLSVSATFDVIWLQWYYHAEPKCQGSPTFNVVYLHLPYYYRVTHYCVIENINLLKTSLCISDFY